MKITIGKLKLTQIEGSTVDDILYEDENGKKYDFDEYMNLIKSKTNE
ncbi:hypothetical protein N8873_00510 [Flavobacteriaceae bacterium]|jgi:hypothetical protein|nr:hypothetical protein [Flavobacteriaceae bacterium]